MAPKNTEFQTVFSNKADIVAALSEGLDGQLKAVKGRVVVVVDNKTHTENGFDWDAKAKEEVRRLLVIFVGLPLQLEIVETWRNWAVKQHSRLLDFRMLSLPDENDLAGKIKTECQGWFVAPPEKEAAGLAIGRHVKMPEGKDAKEKDDPSLLTMMFGSMGDKLTSLELVARRFLGALGKLDDTKRKNYLKEIDELLASSDPRKPVQGDSRTATKPHPDLGIGRVNDRIPKLLLLGETGVGKTLVARYIAEHCEMGRPRHISIPEFLNNENMLEYELFGYAAGAYTGGILEGSHGRFLEKVGQVIFLDEIGEASPEIQTKLLTFLDHFCVSPRGWNGEPFYCPILIVAATNQNLKERGIRPELINRFTDIIEIPPLRERKQDFEFILDCLLQRESMNPDKFVREIGSDALNTLKAMNFGDGNFRELENLFREACKRAHRENRPHLVKADFEKTS